MHVTIVTLENRCLSATESRTLAFGYSRYGRSTMATAELFVSCCGTGPTIRI